MNQKKPQPLNYNPPVWWPKPELLDVVYGFNPIDWARTQRGEKKLEPGPDPHSMFVYAKNCHKTNTDQWYVCVLVGTTLKESEKGALTEHFFVVDEEEVLRSACLSRPTKFNFTQPWPWIPYNSDYFLPPWFVDGAKTPYQGFLNIKPKSVNERFYLTRIKAGFPEGWPL